MTQTYDRVTGLKSCVVGTRDGQRRKLYILESAGVWLEDIGGARVQDGKADVELDPLFLETLHVDDTHPLRIQIAPTSALGCFWVEKHARGFTLHAERVRGSFDWRVQGKRKGCEDVRMEAAAAKRGRE